MRPHAGENQIEALILSISGDDRGNLPRILVLNFGVVHMDSAIAPNGESLLERLQTLTAAVLVRDPDCRVLRVPCRCEGRKRMYSAQRPLRYESISTFPSLNNSSTTKQLLVLG